MMKVLLLVLVLVLVLTSSSALNCFHCVPKRAGEDCKVTTETCTPEKDACTTANFLREPFGHYQKCTKMSDCELLKMNAYISIKCCQDDLCNTL